MASAFSNQSAPPAGHPYGDAHIPYDDTLYEVALLVCCFVTQRRCGTTCASAGLTQHVQSVAAGWFRGGSIIPWWRMDVSASELEGLLQGQG